MSHVALEGCNLMVSFVVPNNHPSTRAEFPLHSEVVVKKSGGRYEEIAKDIADITVDELVWSLVNNEKMPITWVCKKPGERNNRIQVYYSEKAPLQMPPSVSRTINDLSSQTWKYGRIYVIRNTDDLSLIVIEVFMPLGKKRPQHFFDLENGNVEINEVRSASDVKKNINTLTKRI